MKKNLVKKHIIIAVLMGTSLNAAENKIIEWNPAEYAKGNKLQYEATLHFLTHNKIETENKRILDVGCGTGEMSAFLARTAQSVHGFDASHHMIEWAREHHTPAYKNISFAQCRVEDWSSDHKYDLATMFFCFHWFTDKQKALNQTAASLKENGELFGTFSTTDMPQPPGLAIVKEMMEEWKVQTHLNESLGRSSVDTPELKKILEIAGFDIITCELQTKDHIFTTRKDVEDFTRPVMMSRPFIQNMLLEQRERFFTEYIDALLPVIRNNETQELMIKMFMTIVHARKK